MGRFLPLRSAIVAALPVVTSTSGEKLSESLRLVTYLCLELYPRLSSGSQQQHLSTHVGEMPDECPDQCGLSSARPAVEHSQRRREQLGERICFLSSSSSLRFSIRFVG